MALIALDDIIPVKPRGDEPAPSTVRPTVRKDASEDQAAASKVADAMSGNLFEGGFAALKEDLERRTREGANMIRLLQQHRQHLESAEKERDAAYDELARIVSVVQHTGRELKEAMERCKQGELGADLAGLSAKNGKALEDLEKIAVTLNSHFLWCRSAWEQYAKTIVSVQRYRTEMLRG